MKREKKGNEGELVISVWDVERKKKET